VCGSEVLQPCRCFEARRDIRYLTVRTDIWKLLNNKTGELTQVSPRGGAITVRSTCHFPLTPVDVCAHTPRKRVFVQRRQRMCYTLHVKKKTLINPYNDSQGYIHKRYFGFRSPRTMPYQLMLSLRAGASVVDQRCWATRMRVVSAPTCFTNSCRVGPDSSVACVDRTRSRLVISRTNSK
jgi:hypothetical protein